MRGPAAEYGVDPALHVFGADQTPIDDGQGPRLDDRLRGRSPALRGLAPRRGLAPLGRIHLREDARQPFQATAGDRHIVRVVEVLDQGALGRQQFEVPGEVPPSATPPLPVLHPVEEVLG